MAQNWWDEDAPLESAQISRPGPAYQPNAVRRPGEGQRRRRRRRNPPSMRQNTPAAPVTAPTAPAPPAQADKWWETDVPAETPAAPSSAPPVQQTPAQPVQQPQQAPQVAEPGIMEQYVDPALQWLTDAGTAVKTAVVGKQDPRFKDIPTLQENTGLAMDGIAEMTAVSDAALADVWAKTLGDRYLGTIKDANGYPIIRFRGKDGSVQMGYVNKPGLDAQDVSRGLGAAVPYLVGGGIAGGAARGLGTLGNVAAQGLAAGTASVAQDVGARAIGSKQEIDSGRAALAVGLGAGGELVGRTVLPFVRKWIGDRSIWQQADDGTLTLTKRGQNLAKREGVQPDIKISADQAKRVLGETADATNPGQVLVKERTGQFGIPTTAGQRSKDPWQIQTEKDLRFGTFGRAEADRMKAFDDAQRRALEAAAFGVDDAGQAVKGASVGRTLKARPGSTAPDDLGLSAKAGFDAARKRASQLEGEAWDLVRDVRPRSGSFDLLGKQVDDSLQASRVKVDASNTPQSFSMLNEVKAYMEGRAARNPELPEFVTQSAVKEVDEMRRTLFGMMKSVSKENGPDRRAARSIYEGYLNWIDEAAEKNLLTGGPQAALNIRNARGATREFKNLFEPRLADGTKSPTARTFAKIGDADSGEEVLSALLGRSNLKKPVGKGTVRTILNYKGATKSKIGGEAGHQAWNDLRMANWVKMITNDKGELLPPGTLVNNIEGALKSNPTLMKTFYNEAELKLMKQYADAVKQTNWRAFDINPSGTGTVANASSKMAQEAVRFQAQSTRAQATFGQDKSKLISSRLWRMLGEYLKHAEKPAGRVLGNRALSDTVTRIKPPATGGYASGLAPQIDRD